MLDNNKQEQQTFIPVIQLLNKIFVVQDYQRGYKWGQDEITQLLNDINSHDNKKGPYCLQPIIIKPIENNTYEVIDGQQRLTSLYLLMQYFSEINESITYTIQYKTRSQSELFLNNKNNFNLMATAATWQQFIDEYPENNNVDIFHFFEVYKTIIYWFANYENKDVFLQKIKDSLYIIWYDVSEGTLTQSSTNTAENIFINFNANKVDLSNSELIKALFILDHNGMLTKEQKKHNAIELALEWDGIENRLQDDTFWYFICNDEKYNYSSARIDFLFDIIAETIKSKEKLAAYKWYEQRIINEEAKQIEWKKIKTIYYKLNEWYGDKFCYHYIGYLIATSLSTISTILTESNHKKKDDFKQLLQNKIKVEFAKLKDIENVYDLETLGYTENRKECNNVLLLLNVHHYLKDSSSNKFPFNLYHENNWSLEHINPQKPQDFSSVNEFETWLISIESFYPTNIQLQENISKIRVELKTHVFEKIIKEALFKEILQNISAVLDIDKITNLALLDRNTNSALSNNNYLKKREILLRFDKKGYDDTNKPVFIPLCTRDLFTKTYSFLTNKSIGTYFTAKDMEDYKVSIAQSLKDYLPIQTNISESI